MGYVTESDLTAAGIVSPDAADLIEVASLMVDAHCRYPINDDGYKFPREANAARNLEADEAVPPAVVKATIEQIRWMVDVVGIEYVQRGGDTHVSVTVPNGGSETRSATDAPLLAPMAKLYLRPYFGRVGFM